jgi:hypothetical protein
MIWILWLMLLNAAYVAALPAATVLYIANVLLHLVLGTVIVVWLGFAWHRSLGVSYRAKTGSDACGLPPFRSRLEST